MPELLPVDTAKKPIPEDFGLTAQEYELVKTNRIPGENRREAVEGILGLVIWILLIFGGVLLSQEKNIFNILIAVACFVAICFIFTWMIKTPTHPLRKKAALYEEALRAIQRKNEKYWISLRGLQLEAELKRLYTKLGYNVESTPASGDKGIDLKLKRNNKTIIVQCKGHKKPIGVAAVRDLYGTLIHHKVNKAIIVCPIGFTKGVREFVLGKPIDLISATDLVKMSENIADRGK